MEEGSFSLRPECQMVRSSSNKHLGGGQHVEGAQRGPSLLVLVVHGESNLGEDGEMILNIILNTVTVTNVVVNLNRGDLMFSLKDNEVMTSNIENIISSRENLFTI